MAGNAIAYIEGAELTMLVFGKKVLNNISKAVTNYFGVNLNFQYTVWYIENY